MKNIAKSCALALGVGILTVTSGCSTLSRAPTIVKVAATPIAIIRDAADVLTSGPASAIDDFADNFYDSGQISSRRFNGFYPAPYSYVPGSPFMNGYSPMSTYSHGYGYGYGNENVGNAAPLFGGILRLAGFCFAAPNYLLCRSFTPDLEGTSPYKPRGKSWPEHFGLNTKTLWSRPEEPVKKK